jgi:hypothetical protein
MVDTSFPPRHVVSAATGAARRGPIRKEMMSRGIKSETTVKKRFTTA